MKKIILYFIIIIPLFSDNIVEIDLSSLEWYVKDGFDERYILEPSLILPHSIKKYTPIILNEIYPSNEYTVLKHYTLYTTFQLTKEQLYKPLYLYLAWIGENWEIYLNGHSIHKEIYLRENKIQIFRTVLYEDILLNNRFLKEGKNELIIHIIGYTSPTEFFINDNVGLTFRSPYKIVSEEIREYYNFKYKLIPNILSIIYLCFGFYHLFLYFIKGDKHHYYFGLFCIMLFLYTDFFINEYIKNSAFVFKLKYPSQPLLIPLFLAYLENFILKKESLSKITKYILYTSIFLAVLFIIFPAYYFEMLLKIFYIFAIFYVSYSIYFLYKLYKIKNNIIYKIIIISVFGLIFSGIFDILDSIYFYTGVRLLKFAFLGFVFINIILILNDFIQIYEDHEKLTKKLKKQTESFFKFIPKEITDYLNKSQIEEIVIGDQKTHKGSILLFDIKNYTTLSEQLSTESTLSLLNYYFKIIDSIVQQHNGFILKFIGDAVIVLFLGSNHYNEVIEASNKILLHLKEEKEKFRIGIASGLITIAIVGDEHRLDISIMGDTYNRVQLLEFLNKFYNTNIILDEETYKNFTSKKNNYFFRYIDTILVSEKDHNNKYIKLYEFMFWDKNTNLIKRFLEIYNNAIEYYNNKNFNLSIQHFEQALEYINDPVCKIYIKRIQHYKNDINSWKPYTKISRNLKIKDII
ncbi:MAG: adenylate cyclase [Leptospiraceae bacterium]|nr:MAG: adenylate cyclase [Leptospiraceae bacterium]